MNLNRIQQDLLRLYGGRTGGVRGPTPGQQAGQTGGADEAQSTQRNDDVVLSDAASVVRQAFVAIKSAPDVREPLVISLRGQVQAGTYRVPEEELAQKLISLGALD